MVTMAPFVRLVRHSESWQNENDEPLLIVAMVFGQTGEGKATLELSRVSDYFYDNCRNSRALID